MRKETIFSFLLACLLMGGALWVADRSMTDIEAKQSKATAYQATTLAPAITQPARKQLAPPLTNMQAHQDVEEQSALKKCVINGKTLYSDDQCPHGAITKPVEIHHAAGIVSPDRQTIEESLERGRLQRWVNEVPGRSATRTTTRNGSTETHTFENPVPVSANAKPTNKKAQCDWYSEHVKYLDALARQPQSAAMQDWIKDEKAKTQSASFGAGC